MIAMPILFGNHLFYCFIPEKLHIKNTLWRQNGVQGVEGSNPFIPTRNYKDLRWNPQVLFCFLRIFPPLFHHFFCEEFMRIFFHTSAYPEIFFKKSAATGSFFLTLFALPVLCGRKHQRRFIWHL